MKYKSMKLISKICSYTVLTDPTLARLSVFSHPQNCSLSPPYPGSEYNIQQHTVAWGERMRLDQEVGNLPRGRTWRWRWGSGTGR